MEIISKIETLRYNIENGVETDVISISVKLIEIRDMVAEQLRQSNVVRQSEQLVICKKCGSNDMYQFTKTEDKCENCGNIQDY